LFVVAVRGFDLDTVTLLGAWADHGSPQTRVLVMTPDVHCGAVTALRSLPITGVFDSSSSDLRELEFACRAVASGAKYWCPKVAEASASNPAPRRSPGLASGEMLWRLAPPRPVQFHRRTRRKDD
jgi:DNA-binding NarL/FixJ family response regulator